jgi:hypothetical protein
MWTAARPTGCGVANGDVVVAVGLIAEVGGEVVVAGEEGVGPGGVGPAQQPARNEPARRAAAIKAHVLDRFRIRFTVGASASGKCASTHTASQSLDVVLDPCVLI